MFCATFNFMDETFVVAPKFSLKPEGATLPMYADRPNKYSRYAAMPHENVCTENLTPWLKLLPCSSKLGIAALFNNKKLYNSDYHALEVQIRPICQDTECTSLSTELTLSLTSVMNPAFISRTNQNWSFKKLFNRVIPSVCPISSDSRILVDIRNADLTPSGQTTDLYTVYDLSDPIAATGFNLVVKYRDNRWRYESSPPTLHVSRFQIGQGRQNGGVVTLLHNTGRETLPVVYLDILPWYLRMYLHTLTTEVFARHEDIQSGIQNVNSRGTPLKPSRTHYIAGKDRELSYHLELLLRLPPNSVTRISFEFSPALLKWFEYPPDANHGFYANSAIISCFIASEYDSINNKSGRFIRIRTEPLLISMPTPDFSMPYNVICLTCTVIAIAFGSVYNLTTRYLIIKKSDSKSNSFIEKLKTKFSSLIGKSKSEIKIVEETKKDK